MNATQTIATRTGVKLEAQISRHDADLQLALQAEPAKKILLHWGLRKPESEGWTLPPQPAWPPGTTLVGQTALQTPFAQINGHAILTIPLGTTTDYSALEFVLFFPDENRWDNNSGRNYQIPLSQTPLAVLQERIASEEKLLERVFDLPGGSQLATGVTRTEQGYRIRLVSNRPGELLFHWGIARRSPHEWLLPPESSRPQNTTVYQSTATETPFYTQNGFKVVELDFAEPDAPLGIQFVLRDGPDGRWINYRGGNFYLPVQAHRGAGGAGDAGQHADIAAEIIRAEAHNSWTLMHRFNLCHDLLDRVRGSLDGIALIYVYLRFSAVRQLTWQRNFNTKPRELAHAQERLTQKLAEIYRNEPGSRPLARLMLATVGRGGEGQRIRDEILNIMHRHHVKEVSGHFLEEWHQKLHNNTTPDDLVICEAYLAFLSSNGNRDNFYRTLEAGGVTRERLQRFERPIRSDPDFVPHLKDGLLHDFRNFLKILKASHSGTDLETALNAARNQLDGGLQGLLNHIYHHRNDQGEAGLELVRQITEARRNLSNYLRCDSGLREFLYLDLALEQLLRAIIERNIHLQLNGDRLTDLIAWVLENVTLSYEQQELAICSQHWQRLQSMPRFDALWSLHAKSVLDRVSRALTGWIDQFYKLLQPKAVLLGEGFKAEPWTITLFSEEVVRGSSLGFALSALLRHLDPLLRQAAKIGDWQIISRGSGTGQIELVSELRSIQGKRFDSPRIVIADQVTGEEEIPESVTAVVAPDVVDIVSHVAVRARNANVLFASCHDPELFQKLKSFKGRKVRLEINPAGDVIASEAASDPATQTPQKQKPQLRVTPRAFTKYAIPLADFDEKLVGSKSLHQKRLRGRLSDWVQQPNSAALPFGVFEKVLSLNQNRDVAKRYADLVKQTEGGKTEPLSNLRQTVLALTAPEELKSALREAMSASGLAWPKDWDTTWSRIKQVWASKWTDRAFLSRERVGLPHDSLFMAVLVQQVVPADYAFVIHTVNPSNGDREELFGEVVLGLGETLVGNYPGRAMSFVSQKSTGQQTLLSFPGKSLGLYGDGLIFRSDSNGEDLAGYAGAGLYESVLLNPPRSVELDYSHQPLVWNESFRQHLIAQVARIGIEVERACGSPQDIEGTVAGDNYYVVQTRPQVGLS
jgi:alpha-glucan,water dikinase